MQVARVQVQYLHQWLDEKAPPAQVAEADATVPRVQVDDLCASDWMKKHHVATGDNHHLCK